MPSAKSVLTETVEDEDLDEESDSERDETDANEDTEKSLDDIIDAYAG